MLCGGDEIGRTQQRQQQRLLPGQRDLLVRLGRAPTRRCSSFTRDLIRLRAEHPVFTPPPLVPGAADPRQRGQRHRLVHAGRNRDVGPGLAGRLRQVARRVPQRQRHPDDATSAGGRVVDDSFYVMFNAHSEPVEFVLPESKWGEQWTIALDTNDVPDHVDVDKVGRQLGRRRAPARRRAGRCAAARGSPRRTASRIACNPRPSACPRIREPVLSLRRARHRIAASLAASPVAVGCAAAPAGHAGAQPDHRVGGGQPDRRADGGRRGATREDGAARSASTSPRRTCWRGRSSTARRSTSSSAPTRRRWTSSPPPAWSQDGSARRSAPQPARRRRARAIGRGRSERSARSPTRRSSGSRSAIRPRCRPASTRSSTWRRKDCGTPLAAAHRPHRQRPRRAGGGRVRRRRRGDRLSHRRARRAEGDGRLGRARPIAVRASSIPAAIVRDADAAGRGAALPRLPARRRGRRASSSGSASRRPIRGRAAAESPMDVWRITWFTVAVRGRRDRC